MISQTFASTPHAFAVYADDTALFFESNDANKLQDMLNNDLPNICK